MKKIGFYGGSFDPIHNAHVKCALIMQKKLNLDKLIIIPAKSPPHKVGTHTDGLLRYKMCCLAFDGYDNIEVSKMELERDGCSYTCDTVKQLKEQYPNAEIFMFVGADMFVTLDKWKNAEYLLKNTSVVTVAREDIDLKELENKKREFEKYGSNFLILNIEQMKESSTLVRDMIKSGQNIENMVPEKVAEYIRINKLYRG